MRAPKMGDDRENGDGRRKRGRLIFNQGLGSTTPFAAFFCREVMGMKGGGGMKLGYRACSVRIRKGRGKVSSHLLPPPFWPGGGGVRFRVSISVHPFSSLVTAKAAVRKREKEEEEGDEDEDGVCSLGTRQKKEGGEGATGENKKEREDMVVTLCYDQELPLGHSFSSWRCM